MTYGYEETEGFWNFNIYLDGIWVEGPWGGSVPETRPCDSGWYIVSIGGGTGSSGPCFLTMDEVRISEGVLYAWSFTPPSRMNVHPETIAFWDFNEVVGGVVLDQTGHGHDAVLVDGTLVPDECHLP
jgi:hypothetical protein